MWVVTVLVKNNI